VLKTKKGKKKSFLLLQCTERVFDLSLPPNRGRPGQVIVETSWILLHKFITEPFFNVACDDYPRKEGEISRGIQEENDEKKKTETTVTEMCRVWDLHGHETGAGTGLGAGNFLEE